MGLQVRKRTKGKHGWINLSYSKRNGIGVSGSVRVGPVTVNTGNKNRGGRTTTNLGNGVRYVSYGKTMNTTQNSNNEEGQDKQMSGYTAAVIITLVVAVIGNIIVLLHDAFQWVLHLFK